MVFPRIGHGSCYYHWNEIFAGVRLEEVKNFCVYHFEETNLSLQDGLMTKLATVHRQSAQAKPCNTVV